MTYDGRGERIAEDHIRIEQNAAVLAYKILLELTKYLSDFFESVREKLPDSRESEQISSPLDAEFVKMNEPNNPIDDSLSVANRIEGMVQKLLEGRAPGSPITNPFPLSSLEPAIEVSLAASLQQMRETIASFVQSNLPEVGDLSPNSLHFRLGEYEVFVGGKGSDNLVSVNYAGNTIFASQGELYRDLTSPQQRADLFEMAHQASSSTERFLAAVYAQGVREAEREGMER
jgi:hypothetical protein